MRAFPIMKICEKLCDKIENRNPVSANDVVQTCLAVCFLSGLDMLQRRPPDTCSSVGSLALWLSQHLLLCVGEAFCQRRPPKALWSVCLACWTMCTAWLFPTDRKWRRSSEAIEPLWAACCCSRSLLWLSGHGSKKWPSKAFMLLAPHHRWALCRSERPRGWTPQQLRAAVDDLIFLQLLAVTLRSSSEALFGNGCLHGLYCWASVRAYYVGIARTKRVNQRHGTGIASRWLEHMVALLRVSSPDSQRLRYKVMRRVWPDEAFFFVCRAGPEIRIRAMESLEIATRRPSANVRAQRPKQSCPLILPKRRGRPPKHERMTACSVPSRGPFDSQVACSVLDAAGQRALTSQRPCQPRPCVFQVGFASAYRLEQRRFLASTGQFGPVHIFHPALTSLLVSWFCAKHVEIPWEHLGKVWNVGCAPAVLHGLAGQVQGKGRKATLTRRINARLKDLGLPLVCGCTCKVPRSTMLPAVRVALQKAIAAYEGWNHDEKQWVLSRVTLVASRLKKQRDQWNAVQTSKNIRLDQVETCGDTSNVLLQVHGMRRVDNVWDVPIRPDLEEDLSMASACVARACRSLGLKGQARVLAMSSVRTCLLVSRPYRAERGMFGRTHTEYQDYTSDMFRSKDECTVPDDKKKKSMWKVPCRLYQLLLFHFASVSSSWQRTCLSVAEANEWCHSCLQILLTPSLKKFL